jgi:hypothetical protein
MAGGEHFKLDTCRVWMRLHFWAMREEGLHEHAPFADYYVRFISHFVSVYERTAPPFTRDSFRWSADPANTQRYIDQDRKPRPARSNLDDRRARDTHDASASSSRSCICACRIAGRMPDIMGLSHQAAIATLPAEERVYTGSSDGRHWPYEQR